MDAGEIFSSSFRRNTTTGGMEHFRHSSQGGEEDEEALKWAAIEKLPTFDRLRKGLLFGSNGEVTNEVDIADIGYGERQNLIERLVKFAQEDNQKFLQKLRNRLDRVGIVLPTVEVRFEHLKIDVDAYVHNRASPSFINFSTNMMEGLLNSLHIFPSKKKHISILRDVSGIIKPSRMTLLLGPPSSGKTTLLLALAGKLDPNLKVSGNVTYNGHEMHEFVPQRTAAYVSQDDIHIGEMTVRETLAFSARCQGVGSRYDILKQLSRREKEGNIKPDPDIDIYMKSAATEGQEASVVTDYVLRILGLEDCADTLVGDEMIRGISGGQRRRVTTGEMLVGPTNAFFMDEITTGLDSSTAFQIVNSIRHYVHIMKGTALVSLLQPTPETFDLFDDIVLLSDGHIVYQGPREQVLQFFVSMGFKCPERKGVADFLQEVTSKKDQHQYWIGKDEPYRFITASEFSEAYQTFHVGINLGDELAIPFDKSRSHPFALTTKMYGLNKKEILKACFSRELLLIRRNSFFYIFKLTQLLLMAIIAMTLFFRTNMPRDSELDGSIYIAAMFNVVIQIMFNGFSELVMTIQKLPVFFKQRDLLFYPSWAYALPSWILKIPITFFEVGLWVILTYFVIGFDPSASRFFKQLLLLVLLNQTAGALFRFIGAAVRDMIISNTFGSFILLVYFALGGFVLEREQVSKLWIWGYWSSPLMYAQSAILVNEFRGNNWNQVPPNATESLGVLVLKSRGFFPQEYWYWIGVAANCGFIVIFNVCFILSLTYLNPLEKPRSVLVREIENLALVGEGASKGRGPQSNRISVPSRSSSMKADADVVDQSRKRGMVLPFEPHSLTFNNIKYSIDMPQEMKDQGTLEDKLMLLNGLSGAFRPGVLTALMGISGAGKTTLMDVLAGRKTGGYIEGSITISGYPKDQQTFARISGYCEQNDIHSPHVTIYESLVYSAWLRLPVNSKTRKMFIEEVMELVELSPLRNALVGLPGIDGLSTEQRKRLTIAVELVANPSIIFMDEPTSGLDAIAAAIVMRTVRNTVDTGRTVVCTIHQPSIDLFEDFDELFLMKRGGQEIYVGPLGRNSSQLIKYLEGVAGVPKIKYGYNPATWMLEVTASAQELALGVDFAKVYQNSELYRRNQLLIQEFSMPSSGTNDLFFATQYSQPFFAQCMVCLWKQRMSYWRNTSYSAVRFYFTAFIALAFGTMFWNLGSKRRTQQDLFNAIGSMYVAVIFLGFQYSASVQPVVAIERTVFYREKAAGMYSALPYAFGQVMIEIQYVFSQSVVYGVITYAMIGFEWTTTKFFWYLFFICISLLYFTFFGIMIVAASPNPAISAIIGSTFYTLWGVFSGFTIPLTRIPIWWKWYYWTCPVAWSLNGLITSQWGDLKVQLENGELIEDFLKSYYGFRHDFLGVVAIVVFCLMVVFAFIYAFCIKSFNFQRR